MNWNEAKRIIKENVIEGTDLNRVKSSGVKSSVRQVIRTNHRCTKYDYNGEEGFLVRISNNKMNNLDIPWSMLEKCFYSLKEKEGYNGKVFRRYYPQQAKNHSCHVHVVGMIFKKAGVATSDSKGRNYYLTKTITITYQGGS
jgi:hypothetical protein